MRTTSSAGCFLNNRTLRMSDLSGRPASGYARELASVAKQKEELCKKLFTTVMQSIFFDENQSKIALLLDVPAKRYINAINGYSGHIEEIQHMLECAEKWDRRSTDRLARRRASSL